jgi:hypothetical protein
MRRIYSTALGATLVLLPVLDPALLHLAAASWS